MSKIKKEELKKEETKRVNTAIPVSPGTNFVLEIGSSFIKRRNIKDGTVEQIEPDSLLELLTICKEAGEPKYVGRIPENSKILDLFVDDIGDVKHVVMLLPKGRFNLVAPTKTYCNVEHPTLLFYLKVDSGRICDTRIAALKVSKKAQLSDSTRLYRYPFTNVYGDYHVCWGNIYLPTCNTLEEVELVPYTHWLSSMNSSTEGDNFKKYKKKVSKEDLYEDLQSNMISIDDVLVQSKHTYGDFKEMIVNGKFSYT